MSFAAFALHHGYWGSPRRVARTSCGRVRVHQMNISSAFALWSHTSHFVTFSGRGPNIRIALKFDIDNATAVHGAICCMRGVWMRQCVVA
jgi:hypothetical protein